tara:strand:- start:1070 stop:1303 length:234 start_codon:yes stop_codon:yes gene_type:complete
MKLIKKIDLGFVKKDIYDLGVSKSNGWNRKVLVVTLLESGQESKNRYQANLTTDCEGELRIETSVKPYNTKCKGIDY